MRKVILKVISTVNLFRFIVYLLVHGNFGAGNPKDSLLILAKYLSLNAFSYSNERLMGRSLRTSVNLFNVLVNKYLETSSPVILNQIISVLIEEFLYRGENNGRK